MKLATLLVTGASFSLSSAGPAPFPHDVASTTQVQAQWPVFKRALNGWTPPDTLSKRADEAVAEPSTAGNVHSAHGRGHDQSTAGQVQPEHAEGSPVAQTAHSRKPVTRAPTAGNSHYAHGQGLALMMMMQHLASGKHGQGKPKATSPHPQHPQPQIWPDRATFEKAHAHWTPTDKIRWMSTSPFQWRGDHETRAFAERADVDTKFFWKKGTCDNLQTRGCRRGLISLKKYPEWERSFMSHSEPYSAKVYALKPPYMDARIVEVDHLGHVPIPRGRLGPIWSPLARHRRTIDYGYSEKERGIENQT